MGAGKVIALFAKRSACHSPSLSSFLAMEQKGRGVNQRSVVEARPMLTK